MNIIRRIFAHPVTHTILGFIAFFIAYALSGFASASKHIVFGAPLRNTPLQLASIMVCAGLGIYLYKAFERHVEHRADAEFAAAGAVPELAAGLGIGFVLFSAMAGLVALMHGLEADGIGGLGDIWVIGAMAVASGLYEELLFRGILFRQIERWAGSWWALAATSAFFGAAHLANPGATWFAAVAIAFEAGILLGGAYMLTRRLWLAVGIHAAWNFTQGWIFSAPVSGGKAPHGLLITQRHGAEWLTGGAFGLEASAVAMVVATLAGCVMLWLAARRGHFMAPSWKR